MGTRKRICAYGRGTRGIQTRGGMKTTITHLFWSIILTLNLINALAWNYIPQTRPEGVTRGDAAIILAIAIVGMAILATTEARQHAPKD